MIIEILRDSFALYKRFPGRFIATAAIVFAGIDLFAALCTMALLREREDTAAFEATAAFYILILAPFAAWMVGTFWAQGAIIEVVQDVRDGRVDNTIRQFLKRLKPRLPSLLVGGLLAGSGIGIGFVLLTIPGLYLLTRWILIIPVIVIEKKNAHEAFGRSDNLVRGNTRKVFGLVLITYLINSLTLFVQIFILALIVPLFSSWLPLFFVFWIGRLLTHCLMVPYIIISWTLLYYRLVEHRRSRKPVEHSSTPAPEDVSPAAS